MAQPIARSLRPTHTLAARPVFFAARRPPGAWKAEVASLTVKAARTRMPLDERTLTARASRRRRAQQFSPATKQNSPPLEKTAATAAEKNRRNTTGLLRHVHRRPAGGAHRDDPPRRRRAQDGRELPLPLHGREGCRGRVPLFSNSVAQWIAYQTSNLGVAGSIPVGVVRRSRGGRSVSVAELVFHL